MSTSMLLPLIPILLQLGINGAMLYFDYLPGLHYKLAGAPAWLAWFSLVATHSDAVIFIERAETGLTDSQRLEAQVVSDRIPKKVVTMTKEDLGHNSEQAEEIEQKMYALPNEPALFGLAGREKADELEAGITRKYLDQYVDRRKYRPDRLYVQASRRKTAVYSLNHPMYGHVPLTSDTTKKFGPPEIPEEFQFLAGLFRDFLR